MALGKRPGDDKPKKRTGPRPSSARWAELSSTKGTYEATKLKVMEIKKSHGTDQDKTADLSHQRSFKALNQVLEKQRKAEKEAQTRLNHIYGEEHAINIRYNEEEHDRRTREGTKAELRKCLEKYVGSGSENEAAIQNLLDKESADMKKAREVQRKLAESKDKVGAEMQQMLGEYENMLKHSEDLNTYVKLDHFNAKQYVEDAQLNNARIRWAGPDTYTVNDKAQALRHNFKDASRLPYYDQAGGYWDLSTQFSLEDNESSEQKQKQYVHPFMSKYI
jgi:hypothetical protein